MSITGSYFLDPDHTNLGFIARHAMISRVQGTFEEWKMSLLIDEETPANSRVFATVNSASLSTRQPRRDAHLRSSDFLDVRAYPEMTFVSTDVQFQGSDTVYLTGDMTIKDVTRPVTFHVNVTGTERDHLGDMRVGFQAIAMINRADFGIKWNTVLDSGNVLISEEIEINIDGSALKQD
ncbi:YceI family protein [Corynebacterium sp.]|uniref:YceI family protein n=1 Tax=Corynebacterium sp. TaxID=1720 RepID=UPI00373637B1